MEANIARNTALLRQAEANLKRDQRPGEVRPRSGRPLPEALLRRRDVQAAGRAVRLRRGRARRSGARRSGRHRERAGLDRRPTRPTWRTPSSSAAYCEIRSPVDGRTGDLLRRGGQPGPGATTRNWSPSSRSTRSSSPSPFPRTGWPRSRSTWRREAVVVTTSPPGDSGPAESGTADASSTTPSTPPPAPSG